MDIVLWGVLPYLVIVTLVGGTVWRYRYDKFGWTTRSSQLYESRLLRIGSPLFHFGILLVLVGHIGGLVIPESWTEAVGVSEGLYHFNALALRRDRRGLHAGWHPHPRLPAPHDRAGLHGDHPQRQAHVHPARRCDRPRPLDDAGQRRSRLRGAQLPETVAAGHLRPVRRPMGESCCAAAAARTPHRSFADYLQWLEQLAPAPCRAEWQEFVNCLTTNLTAFFREEHHFAALAAMKARAANRCGSGATRPPRRGALFDRDDAWPRRWAPDAVPRDPGRATSTPGAGHRRTRRLRRRFARPDPSGCAPFPARHRAQRRLHPRQARARAADRVPHVQPDGATGRSASRSTWCSAAT